MPMLDIAQINAQFHAASPQEILCWAWETFGEGVSATSSFQTQSVPLLHMLARVTPEMPVLFLDTGFHFPETLAFRDRLVREYGLRLRSLYPAMGHEGFQHQYGDLYRRDPNLCCYINKVEPLKRAMRDLRAWVSGIRRDQTAERSQAEIISLQADGTYKICPLLAWTRQNILAYVYEYDLPEHPLRARGYLSIGCAPCTRPVLDGQDERAGRWAGQNKTECGLHLPPARK